MFQGFLIQEVRPIHVSKIFVDNKVTKNSSLKGTFISNHINNKVSVLLLVHLFCFFKDDFLLKTGNRHSLK